MFKQSNFSLSMSDNTVCEVLRLAQYLTNKEVKIKLALSTP
jgi:hypothetical protein